ncbi:MAG: beta-lactamase induction signal transducer protein [Clostridia bacterium]|nr:beta-lactamase induction signal transducer protein [Clostridia bacterium]
MIFSRLRATGSLRIDRSDPEDSPHLFLELSKGVNCFYRKKYIILKVRNENYISQK